MLKDVLYPYNNLSFHHLFLTLFFLLVNLPPHYPLTYEGFVDSGYL